MAENRFLSALFSPVLVSFFPNSSCFGGRSIRDCTNYGISPYLNNPPAMTVYFYLFPILHTKHEEENSALFSPINAKTIISGTSNTQKNINFKFHSLPPFL
jgi:hypothetical protein